MKFTTITAGFASAAIAAAGAFAAFSAPLATADPTTSQLGSQATLTNGDVVQGWTVTGLKVSTDSIPYQPHGTLWEATATNEALQGNVTPIVSNLNARAQNGDTYRALFGVATPQGVNPSTLSQGEKTTGKVYFDVTGQVPDSVVYANADDELIVWLKPAPVQSPATGSAPHSRQAPAATTSTPATSTSPAPTTSGATPAPTTPPAASPSATTAATPATPAPAGSAGTPLPADAVPAQVPAGSAGTPLPEGEVAPALVPAGTQPAPAVAPEAGAAAVPAPAQAVPAPGGSAGTPLPAGASPTTTVVIPAPAG
ncbi:MPT63 family protein [Mycobacterium sp. BMJ-28]